MAIGEVGQECGDVSSAELGGVALAVVEDESASPVNVGLFGSTAEVPKPACLADLIEEFG